MRTNKDSNDLKILKAQIGFGAAFKATLGFYAAQFVAAILGLIILGTLGAILCVIVYLAI